MNKSSLIREDAINEEATQRAKKDPKYKLLLDWLKENGTIFDACDFPVAFGPLGIIGIAAKKDIPTCTAIMALPNKILITVKKAMNSELKEMFEENPALFKEDRDADFHILATFLHFEKLKGKDSFWYPYLNSISFSNTMMQWDPEEVAESDDPYVMKEAAEFRAEMEQMWKDFKEVYEKYPKFFPPEKLKKEDFIWAYECVMTRCFGWSLPTTMMVPFGDFLNHSSDGATHNLVNIKFETNEDQAPEGYIIKKRKMDLDLFNNKALSIPPQEKAELFAPSKFRIDYVRKNAAKLSKESLAKLNSGNYKKEDLKKMVREINLYTLRKEEYRQIWNFHWYESSDEEDNDSSEGEDDEDEENEGKDSGEVHEKLQAKELNSNKNVIKFIKEEVKTSNEDKDKSEKSVTTISTVKSTKAEESDEDDEEYEDEEEEEEDDDDGQPYKFQGVNADPSLHVRISKYEREEIKKIENKEYQKKETQTHKKPTPAPSLAYSTRKPQTQAKPTTSTATSTKTKPTTTTTTTTTTKPTEQKDQAKEKPKINDDVDKEKEWEDEEESDDDETDWNWYDENDDNNYFVFTTDSRLSYKKGDQIFNCYGRRTNKFLLVWYGFCTENNKYDSLTFRLWMDKSTLSNVNHPKKILFRGYISVDEWKNNQLVDGDKKASPNELTKEFRIKRSKLCEDLISYLRAHLLLTYNGKDLPRILVTIPTSINYEEYVIEYAIQLFLEIKRQYKTSIYEDEEILKDLNLDFKKRFCTILRLEHKRIAEVQLKLLKLLQNFFKNLRKGVSFRDAYMQKVPEIEDTDEEYINHRRMIANYLRLFHHNYKNTEI